MRVYCTMIKVIALMFLFSSAALAQTATGTISGVVSDESGAVVPGVSVTINDVDTGFSTAVTTNSVGRYYAPALTSGHYEIQAQMDGFETVLRRGLQLTAGSELVINLALKVGQVAQRTVVTAEAPIVETASSTLAGLVNDQTIRDLPLNGRSFDSLINLQSAAPQLRVRVSGAGSSMGSAAAYTVNGARSQPNLQFPLQVGERPTNHGCRTHLG